MLLKHGMSARVSLKDVAIRVGVSAMTVSRALRNDPRVLPATLKKILTVAREMNYRPDPNLQQMMGYMRKARVRRRSETIALVWPDMAPEESHTKVHLRRMVQGARERAEEFGFGLDEFWLQEPGMSARRLGAILNARGIQCVILAPLMSRAHGHLRLDWKRYSAVTTGLGLWRPQLPRVHFDHFGSMLKIMRKLARRKETRIALSVNGVLHERMHRAWAAAFLAHHPLGPAEASHLLMTHECTSAQLRTFLKKNKATVLIGDLPAPGDLLKSLRVPEDIRFVTLSHSERYREFPGIDQRDDLLGAYAVDMVVAQFHRGEMGIPAHPKIMLCEGEWRE